MDENQEEIKKEISDNLNLILGVVHKLQRLLPIEESHVGSDLFKLERQCLSLCEKYVENINENQT